MNHVITMPSDTTDRSNNRQRASLSVRSNRNGARRFVGRLVPDCTPARIAIPIASRITPIRLCRLGLLRKRPNDPANQNPKATFCGMKTVMIISSGDEPIPDESATINT